MIPNYNFRYERDHNQRQQEYGDAGLSSEYSN